MIITPGRKKIYHCGASSKDAGKKITSITKIDDRLIYHSMIDELLCNTQLVLNKAIGDRKKATFTVPNGLNIF